MELKEKTTKGNAYGAASITKVLNGVCFPATKDQIIQTYGKNEIQYTKGRLTKIKDIIANSTKETFFTMSELVESCTRGPLV